MDGGYVDSIAFVDPDKCRMSREAVLWSEWVESVRKDVECLFGILKNRFRFFRNGISYKDPKMIEHAFKTCCCLHNMILLFDQGSNGGIHEWETVNWETLDPNDDVEEEMEEFNEKEELEYTHKNINADINATENVYATGNIVIFKLSMNKRILKNFLQVSFTTQWIKQQLEWPKRFNKSQKARLPLERATIEMKRSLYAKDSTLLAKDKSSGTYSRPINKGLISHLGYRRDD